MMLTRQHRINYLRRLNRQYAQKIDKLRVMIVQNQRLIDNLESEKRPRCL